MTPTAKKCGVDNPTEDGVYLVMFEWDYDFSEKIIMQYWTENDWWVDPADPEYYDKIQPIYWCEIILPEPPKRN